MPYYIEHLADCEILLIVAALAAALFPLSERIDLRIQGYGRKTRYLVSMGPQYGSILAIFAILSCIAYAWLPTSFLSSSVVCAATTWQDWILGTSLVLLVLAILVFLLVALCVLKLASGVPDTARQEAGSDDDLRRLKGENPLPPEDTGGKA